jgi:hypothetical protein
VKEAATDRKGRSPLPSDPYGTRAGFASISRIVRGETSIAPVTTPSRGGTGVNHG